MGENYPGARREVGSSMSICCHLADSPSTISVTVSALSDDEDEEDEVRSYARMSRFLAQHPGFASEWFARHGPAIARHRNSLTVDMFRDLVEGREDVAVRPTAASQRDLASPDDPQLLLDLIRDVSGQLDIDSLCHKVLVTVVTLTRSDRGSLFLARGPRNRRYLVPKLFDVTPGCDLKDALKAAQRVPNVPFGVGIAGHVALTGDTLLVPDAYQDSRFSPEVDTVTGYRTASLMCLPISNGCGEVIAVAQCVNKAGPPCFTPQDEQVFRRYLSFGGISIQNAQLFEVSVQEYKKNEVLLGVARAILEETSSLERVLGAVMTRAGQILDCSACRVFLMDQCRLENGLLQGEDRLNISRRIEPKLQRDFSSIFEMRPHDSAVRLLKPEELSDPNFAALARHVASTGQPLNWTGRWEDIAQLVGPPSSRGQTSRPCLTVPVWSREKTVMAVAQMEAKEVGPPMFSDEDISTLEGFSVLCGLGIHNALLYESVARLMAKQRVALDVLSYHATASPEETTRLVKCPVPPANRFQLYSFGFSDFGLDDQETSCATLRMFMELDLPSTFRIPYQVLCRWVLSVKKNYRPVIYHNWRHALNVTQTMFALITVGKMSDILPALDCLAVMVACLCHDLDHRGTNNSFQIKSDSPLAVLYSTSTLEHHHFDQCIMILNSEGNNILQALHPEDYSAVLRIVESCILATDLALYFTKRDKFRTLVTNETTDWTEPSNREILRAMLMTACDVGATTKPWEVQRRTAELVAREFFQQGDLERERLQEHPSAMMDRERHHELPKMQVDFIDSICLPIYQSLVAVRPQVSPLLQGCLRNRQRWQGLQEDRESFVHFYGNGQKSTASTVVSKVASLEMRDRRLEAREWLMKPRSPSPSTLCEIF